MICPECGEQTEGRNHNGRGLRCTACWELLPRRVAVGLDAITGVDAEMAVELAALGLADAASAASADVELLRTIKGVGPKRAAQLIKSAQEVLT